MMSDDTKGVSSDKLNKAYHYLLTDLLDCIKPYINSEGMISYILVSEYSDVNLFFKSLENYINFCHKYGYIDKSNVGRLLMILRDVQPTPNSIHYKTLKLYMEYLWLLYEGTTDSTINLVTFSDLKK